jgi:hypothetical protein
MRRWIGYRLIAMGQHLVGERYHVVVKPITQADLVGDWQNWSFKAKMALLNHLRRIQSG